MDQTQLKIGLKVTLQILIQFACLSFTAWQSFNCVQKYFDWPQASSIRLVDKINALGPSYAICPYDPKDGFNLTILQNCGIEYEDYVQGTFSSPNCPDPKILIESLVLNSQDILANITAKNSFTDLNYSLPIKDLERIDDPNNCYLLDLANDLDIDDIEIEFRLENIDVHVFTHGTFFDSYSYEEIDLKLEHKDVALGYDVIDSLNTQDHPCEPDKHYKKDNCVWDEIHQSSLEQFGCTTPFGPKKSNICLNQTLGQNAIELLNQMRIPANNRCLDPCTTVVPYLSIIAREQNSKSSSLSLKLPRKIKVMSSYLSYKVLSLIAEIGGYVGLFLGVSILDLKNILNFIFE